MIYHDIKNNIFIILYKIKNLNKEIKLYIETRWLYIETRWLMYHF